MTIAVLSPGRTRRPKTRHLSQWSKETGRLHMNVQTNHGRLPDVAHVGRRLTFAPQTSRIHVSCADRRLKFQSHEPTEMPQSSAISRTVNLLLLRTIVLTLAITSSFLDVDGRPERGSLLTEILPSLNRRNQSNTLCTTHCIFTVCLLQQLIPFLCGFSDFKTKLDANALFGTFTHRKNRYDINARVTSATYYSQLSKRSHLQLVS